MGFWGTVFGSGKGGSHYRFRALTEARKALYADLHTALNDAQRDEVLAVLSRSTSNGGITYSAVEGSIHRAMRKLKAAHVLSSYEYDAAMKWLRERAETF